MYIHKSLKLAILALFITTLVIFSGCTTPPINHPPTIISLTANPPSPIEVNQSTVITCFATDQDGDTLTYTWTKTGGTITGSGSTINWTAPAIAGTYTITCTVSDGELSTTQTLVITVITLSEDIVYRFLCVGVGEYINYGDDVDFGEAPPYDLIYQVLGKWEFGPEKVGFSTIAYISDFEATKNNILQGIASTFFEADDDDVSYFYFGGHGGKYGSIYYICPADMTSSVDSKISVNELEEALRVIPGTKVVIIDSCYSGGFIGKGGDSGEFSDKDLKAFNNDIVKVFSSKQNRQKDLLTADYYKVLTSCSYNQISETFCSFEGNTIGVFTVALLEGCGYNYFPADSDNNGEITLEETYLYVKDKTSSWGFIQDVQVYPINSNFIFAEY